jgi:hypothetical protein
MEALLFEPGAAAGTRLSREASDLLERTDADSREEPS